VPELGNTLGGEAGRSRVPWSEIADSPEFRRLEALRRRAMVGTLSIFGALFGAFLVLSAYARPFMRKSVDGGLTVAYVWILALTVVAWVLVWSYLRFAERLEAMSHEMLKRGGYGEQAR